MSSWAGRLETCPSCGAAYEDFKTGLNFSEVRMMLWVADPDYSKWRYKRRHTVLGLWHQLKQSMWSEHVNDCEDAILYYRELGDAREEPGMEAALQHLSSVEGSLHLPF